MIVILYEKKKKNLILDGSCYDLNVHVPDFAFHCASVFKTFYLCILI